MADPPPAITGLLQRYGYIPALLVVLVLLGAPAISHGAAFPLYDRVTSHSDNPTTDTWFLYPFFSDRETTSTRTVAFHPLWAWHVDRESGSRELDVLFPLFTWRHHPEKGRMTNYRRSYLFPLYFHRTFERNGAPHFTRTLIPFWFAGTQGNTGTYRILFPFIWYAYNAEMAFPLFPSRPQTFAAIWPLIGDFRGYYNRDRIFFFLWPLIVYSSHGTGEDFIETSSLVWPILARHGGHNVSGFRVWPLFSTVTKTEDYTRSYFLWPLGHRRTGRISRSDAREQDVFMFLPFYARIRRPDFDFDMAFPFYGSLRVGMREVDGYLLALYNTERNYRRGTQENRILWFIWRWRKPLEGFDRDEVADSHGLGGGLFPIYTDVRGNRSRRQNIIWPIYHNLWNEYDEYEFSRRYLVPFFSSQKWEYKDGPTRFRRYFFPFFRQTQTLDGNRRENSLHLWFHTEIDSVDRLYAPIWEFWKRHEDTRTGEKSIHWFQTAHRFERHKDGTERRRTNLLFFDRETIRDGEGDLMEGSTRLFWGLVGTHKSPEDGRQFELLWMKF